MNTDNHNDLGKLIKQLRKEKKLSLRDLSEMTGISHAYIHKLEQGEDSRTGKPVIPSIPVLTKLAEGLDVPLESLLFIDGLTSPGNAAGSGQEDVCLLPVLDTITPQKIKMARKISKKWLPVDNDFIQNYSNDIDSFFYLRVHGHSMVPIINNQDLVLVFQGPVAEGETGVVIFDKKDTKIGKLLYLPEQDLITLVSRNREFPPITKRLKDCLIIGQVILRIGIPKW